MKPPKVYELITLAIEDATVLVDFTDFILSRLRSQVDA